MDGCVCVRAHVCVKVYMYIYVGRYVSCFTAEKRNVATVTRLADYRLLCRTTNSPATFYFLQTFLLKPYLKSSNVMRRTSSVSRSFSRSSSNTSLPKSGNDIIRQESNARKSVRLIVRPLHLLRMKLSASSTMSMSMSVCKMSDRRASSNC